MQPSVLVRVLCSIQVFLVLFILQLVGKPPSCLVNCFREGASSNVFKFKNEKGTEIVIGTKNGSFITFDDIDLNGISNLSVAVTSVAERTAGGILEIHLDGVSGPKVGEGKVDKAETINIPIKAPGDNKLHKLFFVFKNPSAGPKPLFGIEWIKFDSAAM